MTGEMRIRHAKEGKKRRIYLPEDDLDFINSLPRAPPEISFFRHGWVEGAVKAYRIEIRQPGPGVTMVFRKNVYMSMRIKL